MKKYLLFGGSEFYPEGGVDDLLGDFDTIEEAKAFWDNYYISKEERASFCHIVEYASMRKVGDLETDFLDLHRQQHH